MLTHPPASRLELLFGYGNLKRGHGAVELGARSGCAPGSPGASVASASGSARGPNRKAPSITRSQSAAGLGTTRPKGNRPQAPQHLARSRRLAPSTASLELKKKGGKEKKKKREESTGSVQPGEHPRQPVREPGLPAGGRTEGGRGADRGGGRGGGAQVCAEARAAAPARCGAEAGALQGRRARLASAGLRAG